MCLKYSYVPKVWKEGTGIFIPKPGKENYHEKTTRKKKPGKGKEKQLNQEKKTIHFFLRF